MVITTSSVEAVHGELAIVQRSVAVPGIAKPVTPDVGEFGLVMVAVPETTVQVPVPVVGVLPAKVTLLILHAGDISDPALAVVGGPFTVMASVWAVPLPQPLLGVTVRVPEVAAPEKLAVMELVVPPEACV